MKKGEPKNGSRNKQKKGRKNDEVNKIEIGNNEKKEKEGDNNVWKEIDNGSGVFLNEM